MSIEAIALKLGNIHTSNGVICEDMNVVNACIDLLQQLVKGTEYENNVFIAGGFVRDQVLIGMGKNVESKDIDLVVNLPEGGIAFANFVTQKLGIAKEGSNPVIFPRFGTAQIHFIGVSHNGIDLSDMTVETVMPRVETYAPGNRKPEVALGTLRQDVERRDLTANSLLQNISTGEILDLTGHGVQDIKAGVIRTPLDPAVIFKEDPLRMLRAIRFAVKYDWQFAPEVLDALRTNAQWLQSISRERVRDELNKMLTSSDPKRAIKLLMDTGLVEFVHPKLAASLRQMVGMAQNRHHHLDVFNHVLEVIANASPGVPQRLAALLHDIAKPQTRTPHKTNEGEFSFLGHEDEGATIAKEILADLKYPQSTIDGVTSAVQYHMGMKDPKAVSDKAVRKWVRGVTAGAAEDAAGVLDVVLDLLRADALGHLGHDPSDPGAVAYLKQRIETTANQNMVKQQKVVTGHDLMSTFGLPPGPKFKEFLALAQDMVDENPNTSKDEILAAIGNKFNLKPIE